MQLVVKNVKERLDKYLAQNSLYSRSLVSKLINEGLVLVNGKTCKASYLLKDDDIIDVTDSDNQKTNLVGTNIPLNIVYEDDDLMVINKQSGLVVHPGNGNADNTLVNALIYHHKSLSDNDIRPGIVHRLDKDTSGLMLVAKTNKAHEILSDDFKNKKVKREYVALVDGVFPHNKAIIDAPIGRDDNKREIMAVKGSNSKKAITHLEVIKRYPNNTLISLLLDTGRTHQIRAHMKYVGYPIHNDPIYNSKKATSFGQFLHSAKIDFIHPITKKAMHFESCLPKEFKDWIDKAEKGDFTK